HVVLGWLLPSCNRLADPLDIGQGEEDLVVVIGSVVLPRRIVLRADDQPITRGIPRQLRFSLGHNSAGFRPWSPSCTPANLHRCLLRRTVKLSCGGPLQRPSCRAEPARGPPSASAPGSVAISQGLAAPRFSSVTVPGG